MSYAGVVHFQTELLEKEWHYIILDEGHKIRNPDAKATLVVKKVSFKFYCFLFIFSAILSGLLL